MNYMTEVAKMLGVELGEEFEVNENESFTCHFTDEKFSVTSRSQTQLLTSSFVEGVLCALIYGGYTIKRKPWKPRADDHYWIVKPDGEMMYSRWYDETADSTFYKIGNCYRTYKEAEADRDKWVAFYSSDEVLEI